MKKVLIILLILILILLLLYFLFYRKKKRVSNGGYPGKHLNETSGIDEISVEKNRSDSVERSISSDSLPRTNKAQPKKQPHVPPQPDTDHDYLAEFEQYVLPEEKNITDSSTETEDGKDVLPINPDFDSKEPSDINMEIAPELGKLQEELLSDDQYSEPVSDTKSVRFLKTVSMNEKGISNPGPFRRIIAINLETPNANHNRICNVAMTYDENGEKVCCAKLIDPECEFDGSSSKTASENTERYPSFPEIWPELSELFDGSLVIAHNTAFDISVLRKTLSYYQLPVPDFSVACTYKLTRANFSDFENYKLATVCKEFNIPVDVDDAVSHSNACYEIFRRLVREGIPVYDSAKKFEL